MLGVEEKHYQLLVLASAPNTDYFYAVVQAFGKWDSATTLHVNTIDEANRQIHRHTIDGIILDDTPAMLRWASKLKNTQQANNINLFICVLTTNAEPALDTDFSDLVLPIIPPPFIVRQVRLNLKQHQSRFQLQVDQREIGLLKNAIVRNVSHELKTPLLQVKSAVALITEDTPDSQLSRMAIEATARLEAIIKNITLLADTMNGSFGPILVSESINHAIRNLRRSWSHKNAEQRIILEVEPGLPPVMADKQGLGIALQQLLDNALKFSQDSVIIRAESCNSGVRISISDFGIGIEQSKLQQIFDSFYQVDSSSTRRYGGTGVGLAIVRIIMEKHGVKIDVDSKLGVGSTFYFVLSIADLQDGYNH